MKLLLLLSLTAWPLTAGWITSASASIDLFYGGVEYQQSCSNPQNCNISIDTRSGLGGQQPGYAVNLQALAGGGSLLAHISTQVFDPLLPGGSLHAGAGATASFTDWVVVTGPSGGPSGIFTVLVNIDCSSDGFGGADGGGCVSGHSVSTQTYSYVSGIPFQVSISASAGAGVSLPGSLPQNSFGNNQVQIGFSGYIGTPGNTQGVFSQSGAFGTQANIPEPGTWVTMAAGFAAFVLRRKLMPRR